MQGKLAAWAGISLFAMANRPFCGPPIVAKQSKVGRNEIKQEVRMLNGRAVD